jgi:hypothetical protein
LYQGKWRIDPHRVQFKGSAYKPKTSDNTGTTKKKDVKTEFYRALENVQWIIQLPAEALAIFPFKSHSFGKKVKKVIISDEK